MKKLYAVLLACFVTSSVVCIPYHGLHAEDRDYWMSNAQSKIQSLLDSERITRGRAKNIILFIGDGMGITTVTAGRILRGQQLGLSGEEYQLVFEKFPHVAFAKTYTLDSQVGDSSACATALMCGVKAKINTVGLDYRGVVDDCKSTNNSKVSSLIDWSQKHGKSTGIVTNTRLTHGTPAALYAHSPSRYWEDNSRMNGTAKHACKDIARQLVEDDPGRNIDVLLGGGRRHWMPETDFDKETREPGRRTDGKNLIDSWLRDKKERELHAEYVWNKGQFDDIDPRRTDYLLGMFEYSHMNFEADRNRSQSGNPSLAEMTQKAIQILQRNPHGFFLMVEAGRMDHAHHYNHAARALDELITLEESISVALKMVDLSKTLVLVTADHSATMTVGGSEVPRGNPILGMDLAISDVDNRPYTTILYGNGPGYTHALTGERQNLSGINTQGLNYRQQTAVPRRYGTHGAEDVPVYAAGPGSYLFSGTVEQTYIAHAIAYAACIGSDTRHCEQPHGDDASAPAVSRPLYPRIHDTEQFTPASAPVEERKTMGDLWGWQATHSGCNQLKISIALILIVFTMVVS